MTVAQHWTCIWQWRLTPILTRPLRLIQVHGRELLLREGDGLDEVLGQTHKYEEGRRDKDVHHQPQPSAGGSAIWLVCSRC